MQSDSTIHYFGNTIARSTSNASIRKRLAQGEAVKPMQTIIPVIDKVFATSQCIWCNHKFEEYRISCLFCHNCQYCGMVAASASRCQNCGNHTDEQLEAERSTKKTVIFGE